MQPELRTLAAGAPGAVQDLALQQHRVLRNTYMLLALSMIPTVIGAAVGGLAGAVWADNDRDGQADGYVYNGQYYNGAPQGAAPAPTYTPPARSGERG